MPEIFAIRRFFELPVFVGCQGWDHRVKKGARALYEPGDKLYHRAAYFVPILAYYTGARREELCGLTPDDLLQSGDHYVLVIQPNAVRKLKNDQSKRHIALHPELIRLGFPSYVEAIRQLRYDSLFPELATNASKSNYGNRLYDELEVGFKTCGFSTHQFRHLFNDALKQNEVSAEIRADLMGHGGSSETTERYVKMTKIKLQATKIDMLDIVTDHLPSRESNLLPWISKRQPARSVRKRRI